MGVDTCQAAERDREYIQSVDWRSLALGRKRVTDTGAIH
jgi:hypothetical protein